MFGPLVLAVDENFLGDKLSNRNDITIASPTPAGITAVPEPAPEDFKTWPHAQVFRLNTAGTVIRLVPFADAGSKNGKGYKVWLPWDQKTKLQANQ